jgi:hypothetical protein
VLDILKRLAMFKIKNYQVCKATGFVSYECEFAAWRRMPRMFKENFAHEADAVRRIESLEREYLLFTIENFVRECRELIELNYTHNIPVRKVALEKCTAGIHYLQDKQLRSIAETILKLEPFLQKLLPPAAQAEFNVLEQALKQLVYVSSKILTFENNAPCLVS